MHPNLVSLMISVKFNQHTNRLCWSESILQGTCPCLPPTTLIRHVVVLMFSRLQWFLSNVVEILAWEGRNATSWKPIWSSPKLTIKNINSNNGYLTCHTDHIFNTTFFCCNFTTLDLPNPFPSALHIKIQYCSKSLFLPLYFNSNAYHHPLSTDLQLQPDVTFVLSEALPCSVTSHDEHFFLDLIKSSAKLTIRPTQKSCPILTKDCFSTQLLQVRKTEMIHCKQ